MFVRSFKPRNNFYVLSRPPCSAPRVANVRAMAIPIPKAVERSVHQQMLHMSKPLFMPTLATRNTAALFLVNLQQNKVQLRLYARMTRRQRREALTKEAQEEQQQSGLTTTESQGGLFSWGRKQQEQQERIEEERMYQASDVPPDATAESLITPEVQAQLVKVYGTLAAAVSLAAVGGATTFLLPVTMLGTASVVGLLGGLGALLGLMFTNPAKVGLRQNLLWAFAFLEGLAMAKILAIVSPAVIVMALAGTASIFAGFSLAALKAKSRTFLMLGGPLFAGVIITLLAGVIAAFGPMIGLPVAIAKALYNVNLWLGLGIFSLFVAHDTQQMIHGAREGNLDHVSHSLNMFLNLINIFVRLLQIFRSDN